MEMLRRDRTEGEYIDWNDLEEGVVYGYTWDANEAEVLNSYTMVRTTQFDYHDYTDPDTFVQSEELCRLYILSTTSIDDGYLTVREVWIPHQITVNAIDDEHPEDFVGGMHQPEEDDVDVGDMTSNETKVITEKYLESFKSGKKVL